MSVIHNIIDSDVRFVFDPITNKLNTTSSKKTLAQGSHERERFTFELPRYIEGHDMSLCNQVEVHYCNTDTKTKVKSEDVYEANDLTIEGDKVVFSWLIRNSATMYVGSLSFSFHLKCVDDNNNLLYECPSNKYDRITISAVQNSTAQAIEPIPDLLASWKANALEDINEAVDKAQTAATNANTYKTQAQNLASAASTSAVAADTAATNAHAAAVNASTLAGYAQNYAVSAGSRATIAEERAAAAEASATQAEESASASAESATQASNSATSALGAAQIAQTQSLYASNYAINASNANTNAHICATNAEESATQAEASAESALASAIESATVAAPAILCQADGEAIHIDDSAERLIQGLKIIGKTAQKTLTGKNLCMSIGERTWRDFGAFPNDTVRDLDGKSNYKGVTYNNYCYAGNVDYCVTHSSPEGVTFRTTDKAYTVGIDVKVEPSTSYYLSAVDTDCGWSVAEYTEDGTYIGAPVIGSMEVGRLFTTSATTRYILILFYPPYAGDYLTVTQPFLNLGSNQGYEEYCGGKTSPNPEYPQDIECVSEGTKITVCGKNLLLLPDKAKTSSGITVTFDEEDQTFTINGTLNAEIVSIEVESLNIPIKTDTSYSLRVHKVSGTMTNGGGEHAVLYLGAHTEQNKKNNWFCAKLAGEAGVTASSGDYTYMTRAWVYISSKVDGGFVFDNYKVKYQFEESDTDTEYEPYVGYELTTPCDLYEGDIWYPQTGKVVEKSVKFVFDGTESWGFYTGKAHTFTSVLPNGAVVDVPSSCTHYKGIGAHLFDIENGFYPYHTASALICDMRFSTVEDFKAYLAEQYANGTPVTVVATYRTGTSESQYEPVDLSTLKTFYPVTNIVGTNDASIDVVYLADTKIYLDHIEQTANSVREDADNGEFDGVSVVSVAQTYEAMPDRGINEITMTLSNGETSVFLIRNGSKGAKPEKGIDYFTQEDKAEMVADVIASLPEWTGGEY